MKNNLLILIAAAIGPYILKLTRWPIESHHQVGIMLLAITIILYLNHQAREDSTIIKQVFEAKKVQVDDVFPLLLKGDRYENRDI